jgi:tripartite-type tricarboxylate transporter receptor subunit TctC
VPYRGSSDALTSVLANQTSTAIVNSLPVIPLVQGRKLKALAVTSTKRLPDLPAVPTMKESGLTEVDVKTWSGLFVPAGTPAEIVSRLEKASRTVMRMPDIQARLLFLSTSQPDRAHPNLPRRSVRTAPNGRKPRVTRISAQIEGMTPRG